MSDFAAAPLQPVAQALLRIVAGVPTIVSGRGFLPAVARIGGAGGFRLDFDRNTPPPDPVSIGLPGDIAVDPNHLRSHVTARAVAGAPPTTTLVGASASFVATPGSGATSLVVTTSTPAGPADPSGIVADGIEILAWRGNAGPDDANQQLVGPLFQSAMAFP